MQNLQVNNSIIRRINTFKILFLHELEHIGRDFQICISVPLMTEHYISCILDSTN